MTAPNQPKTATDQDHHQWERANSQDPLLQVLARLLEGMSPKYTPGLAVTLSTGGMLVSGTLISSQWYFDQLGTQYINSNFKAIATIAADFRTSIQQRAEAGDKNDPYLPNFIHLMNAKFYVPGEPSPIPSKPGEGVLWRGRLSAVDGVTFGSITTTPESKP
jgi:hypothetical protein